jgi:hypothetical protein
MLHNLILAAILVAGQVAGQVAAPPPSGRALAEELVRGVAGGRTDGLELFARDLEAEAPAGRAAFRPAWTLVRNTLKDPNLRARVRDRSRLDWLCWRIDAAFASKR